MKKHLSPFITLLAALSLVVSSVMPAVSQAQTATSTSGGGGGGSVSSFCYTWNTNLGVGSVGNDVSALQNALQLQGLLGTSGSDKGSFNESVAAAVSGFQEKYASEILAPNGLSFGTGYVGAATRAKLNALYGCGTSVPPTSEPTSTAGGGGGGVGCYLFSNNLGLGATGPDVVALQTWLLANGYHLVAIESGAQPKGYYGNQTGDAVKAYQAANGITGESYAGYGYFGTKTRAKVNTSCDVTVTPVTGNRIVTSLDPASPLSSTVTVSFSQVPMAVFDVQSVNATSTLKTLKLNVSALSNGWVGNAPNSLFSDLIISAGGNTYSLIAYGDGNGRMILDGLNILLPANQTVPVMVYGTILSNVANYQNTTGQITLNASNESVVATALDGSQVNVQQGSFAANTIRFVGATSAVLSNTSAKLGTPVLDQNGVAQSYPVSYTFTLTAGTAAVFLGTYADSAANASIEFAAKSGNIVPSNGTITAVPAQLSGDVATRFLIPAGTSRTFTYSGTLAKSNASASGLNVAQIIAIQYGISTTNVISRSLTSGLDNLKVSASFSGAGTVTPPPSNNTVTFQADFTKAFNLSSVPSSVTLSVAADNQFMAYVNGNYVGAGADTVNGDNFDKLATFNIAPYLHSGSNTIKVTAQNYYSTYTSWPNNAFGLLYKVSDSNGNILAASNGSESISNATISGGSSVVMSQPHQWYITVPGASWIWDSADPLYATYLSYIGQTSNPTSAKLALSLASAPADGVTLTPGQTATVAAYKLQAGTASPMAMQSFNLDTNVRLWLYASAITVKDDSGYIIGQLSLNQSNASEIVVGSDYRVMIPMPNYVISAGSTRTFTVSVTALPSSDRQSGPISFIQAQARAVDKSGVTDTENVFSTRTFNYQSIATGGIVAALDPSTPLSSTVSISQGAQTQNVPLAVFDVKSQSKPANLQSVSYTINTSGKSPEQLFSQYSLRIGGQTFGAQSIIPNGSGNATKIVFTNFGNVGLPADVNVPLTLLANVQQDTNGTLSGTSALATLIVGSIVAVDANYNTIPVSTSAASLSGNTFTFTSGGTVTPPTVTPASVTASLLDGSSDKVGTFGTFGPGKGSQNGSNPYDWHFTATVSTAGKTIKSIRVLSNDNWQGWSTIDPGNYPMVVYANGSQINSSYSSLNKSGDSVTLDLYGQPETTTWPGGNILVTFTDGTTATGQIAASSITISSVATAAPATPTSVVATIDSTSPLANLVQISASAQTQNVPLMVFDVKSQGGASTIQSLTFNLNTTGASVSSLFSGIQIRIGSQTISASSIFGSTILFTNLKVALPADTYVPIAVLGTVQPDTNGALSGSSVTAQVQTVGAVDSNSKVVQVQGTTLSGSTLSFSSSQVMVSNTSATINGAGSAGGAIQAVSANFSFTLTAGNSTIFVSADPSVLVQTGVTGNTSASMSIANVAANPNSLSGDTAGSYYVIPAGASRQFTLSGSVASQGAGAVVNASINQINYGTSPTSLQTGSITQGLSGLRITTTLGATASTAQSSMTASIYDAIRAYYAGH